MKRIKVLYQYVIDPAITVFSKWDTCLYVTSKAFADANHCMSDGPAGDPDYEPIQQALESLGYSEACESICQLLQPKAVRSLYLPSSANAFQLLPLFHASMVVLHHRTVDNALCPGIYS